MATRDDCPNPAARIEDLTFLAHHHVGATEAARRTGFTNTKALDKFLRRHGHVTLLNRLTGQDYSPIGDRWPTRHKHLERAS